MRKIRAVFTKQTLSFIRNPARWGVPVAFLFIPFMFLLLVPGMLESDEVVNIVPQFTIMFIGISMIGSSAGFITEDRMTMNLRFMGMAGVKPYQYLIGTSATILLVSLIALILFGLMMGHTGGAMVNFLTISMLGAACSMLLGITLSLSKIAPFTPIVGLLLGVLPIMGDFNVPHLTEFFSFTFTQQINYAMRKELTVLPTEAFQVIAINFVVLLAVFLLINARTGLDGEKRMARG